MRHHLSRDLKEMLKLIQHLHLSLLSIDTKSSNCANSSDAVLGTSSVIKLLK